MFTLTCECLFAAKKNLGQYSMHTQAILQDMVITHCPYRTQLVKGALDLVQNRLALKI
jgi:hypothetical protein